MARVLIAGATGYLGRYLAGEAKRQGHWVRALARDAKKLEGLREYVDDAFVAEVTKPNTLSGICDGIDCVVSTIGITRQKDRLTYMDVDYQGNMNLLYEAIGSGVGKFVYVSVINAHLMTGLKIVQAKELFVNELIKSELNHTVIRPTGFFSDMLDFLKMAQNGRIFLFGSGRNRINPVHGADLAESCIKAMNSPEKEISVGGPEIFTYAEIAELAFKTLNRKPRISRVPAWVIRMVLPMMRAFTSSKTYGPLEFMMSIMTMDVVGQVSGKVRLRDFFEESVHHGTHVAEE
jgi:uncharacterized protein YbjT (DUF2867 family)